MKLLLIALITSVSFSAQAAKPKSNTKIAYKIAAKPCTFMRHQYVAVEGEQVPKELENKILNSFNPDEVLVIKENEEYHIKACTSLHPLKKIKDVPMKDFRQGEEHIITKVRLEPKDNFWSLKIDTYARHNEKNEDLQLIWGDIVSKSPKTIKDIKNAEVADWVFQRVKTLSSK
jgi:hypothetical protein